MFLDADTATLVRRYGDTKRRHPLLQQVGSVEVAIEEERDRLSSVRESADYVIDTSSLNIHDLRRRVIELFGDSTDRVTMQVTLMSFGYKHGIPPDADLILDCRFLPNPHWVDTLRPLTGLDPEVQEYVYGFELTGDFLDRLEMLLDLLLPAYTAEGKSVLTLALGCTGGRHRSVAIAERVRGVAQGPGRRAPHPASGRGSSDARPTGPRVVAVGGGHGLAATLRAARTYAGELTGDRVGGRRRGIVGTAAGRRAASGSR